MDRRRMVYVFVFVVRLRGKIPDLGHPYARSDQSLLDHGSRRGPQAVVRECDSRGPRSVNKIDRIHCNATAIL